MFMGNDTPSLPLQPLLLFFEVDVAVAAAVVGFKVTVGSIRGGLYARNIGFIGAPLNS